MKCVPVTRQADPPKRILIYGEHGAGKGVLASKIAAKAGPALWLDLEAGNRLNFNDGDYQYPAFGEPWDVDAVHENMETPPPPGVASIILDNATVYSNAVLCSRFTNAKGFTDIQGFSRAMDARLSDWFSRPINVIILARGAWRDGAVRLDCPPVWAHMVDTVIRAYRDGQSYGYVEEKARKPWRK